MNTFLLIYTFIAGMVGWAAAIAEWSETRESPFWIRLSAFVLVAVSMYFFWPISLAMYLYDKLYGGK